jgi:aspartyl aminopeptidase
MLSADMAHGMHPNYSEKHHPQHAPRIHEGIVIKTNANQRYMTDSVGASIVRQLAKLSMPDEVPIQDFIVKNDSACGSTIGPMMAAKAGLKTVDIGAPMFGMHSIRETCGVVDLLHYKRLFDSFFNNYSAIQNELMDE